MHIWFDRFTFEMYLHQIHKTNEINCFFVLVDDDDDENEAFRLRRTFIKVIHSVDIYWMNLEANNGIRYIYADKYNRDHTHDIWLTHHGNVIVIVIIEYKFKPIWYRFTAQVQIQHTHMNMSTWSLVPLGDILFTKCNINKLWFAFENKNQIGENLLHC